MISAHQHGSGADSPQDPALEPVLPFSTEENVCIWSQKPWQPGSEAGPAPKPARLVKDYDYLCFVTVIVCHFKIWFVLLQLIPVQILV